MGEWIRVRIAPEGGFSPTTMGGKPRSRRSPWLSLLAVDCGRMVGNTELMPGTDFSACLAGQGCFMLAS